MAGRGTMVSTSSSYSSLLVRLSAAFLLLLVCWTPSEARVIQKRAAFYIANDTMCIVDGDVYRNGDPVPTDDQCERCTCRPPGFSCVLRDCDTKPGCKAVRKAGECCPDYVCGCVHNNRVYEDGEVIKDLQNACYTCRCHGSSISCTFADCLFRGDCPPEYVQGECCPRYDHCPPISSTTSTTTQLPTQHPIVQQEEIHYVNLTTMHVEKFTTPDTTVTVHSIIPVTTTTTTTAAPTTTTSEPWVTVQFTLSSEGKISSIKDFDLTTLSSVLPVQTATYTETTRFAVPDEVTGDLKTISQTTQSPQYSTEKDIEILHQTSSEAPKETDDGFETSAPELGSSDIDSLAASVTHHTTSSSETEHTSEEDEITSEVTKEHIVTISEGGFELIDEVSSTVGKVTEEAETTGYFDSKTSETPFHQSDEPSTETHEVDITHSTTIASTDVSELATDASKESSYDVHEVTESSETSTELSHTAESHPPHDLESFDSSSDVSQTDDSHSTTVSSTEATETTTLHPKTESSSSSEITESHSFSESTSTSEVFSSSGFSEESTTESYESTDSKSTVFLHSQESTQTTSISSDDVVDGATEIHSAEVVTSTAISEKRRPDIAPSVLETTETPDGDITSSEGIEDTSDVSVSSSMLTTQANLPVVEEEHALDNSSESSVSFEPYPTTESTTTEQVSEEDLSTHESSGDSDTFTTARESFSTDEITNDVETTTPSPQSSDPQDLNTDESGTDEVLLSKKATPSIEESSTSDRGEYTESTSTAGYVSESHSALDAETESIEASGSSESDIPAVEIVSSTMVAMEMSSEVTATSTHVSFTETQHGQEHKDEETAVSSEESADSSSTITASSTESSSVETVHFEDEVSTQRPEMFSDHPSLSVDSTTDDVTNKDEDRYSEENQSSDVETITVRTISSTAHEYSTTPQSVTEEITTFEATSHKEELTSGVHSETDNVEHGEVTPGYQTSSSNFTELFESEESFETDDQNVSMSHIPGEGENKPAADVLYPTDLVSIEFPHRPVFEDEASTTSEVDKESHSNVTDHEISDIKHAIDVEHASSEPESLDSETVSHSGDFDSSTPVPHHVPAEGSGFDEQDKTQSFIHESTVYVETSSTFPYQPESIEEDSHSHTNEPINKLHEHETAQGHPDVDENLDTKSENSTFEKVSTEEIQESETASTTEDYDASSVYDSKVNDSNSEISNTNKDGSPKPSTLDEIFSESLENEDLAQNLTDENSNHTYEVDPFIAEKPVDEDDQVKGVTTTLGNSLIHTSSIPPTDHSQETTFVSNEDEVPESHTEASDSFDNASSNEQETGTVENIENTSSTESSDLYKPEIENNEIDFSSEPHQTEHSSVNVEDNVLHAFGSETESGFIDNKSNPHTEAETDAESSNESDNTFDLFNAESNSELANSHTHTTTENHETTVVSNNDETERVTSDEEGPISVENNDENQQTSHSSDAEHSQEETSNNTELDVESESSESTGPATEDGESSEPTGPATEDGESSPAESYTTDAEVADSETEMPHVETLVPHSFNTQSGIFPTETTESVETLVPESFNTQPGIHPTETSEGIETLIPENFMVHHQDSNSTPTDESNLETLVPESLKGEHDVPFDSIADFGGENAESASVPSELTSESGTEEIETSTHVSLNHDAEHQTTKLSASTELHNFNLENDEDEESLDSEPETEKGEDATDGSSSHSTTTAFNVNSGDSDHTPTIELNGSETSTPEQEEPSTSTDHISTIKHEEEISTVALEEHFTSTEYAPLSEEEDKVSTEKINPESVPTPVRVHVLFGQQEHYTPHDETPVTKSAPTLMEDSTTLAELEFVDEHEGSAALHENDEDPKTSVLSETLDSSVLEENNHEENSEDNLEYHEQEGEEISTEAISTESDKIDTTESKDDVTSTADENDVTKDTSENELNASSINSTQINSTYASPETPTEESSNHDKYDVFGYLGNLFSELTTLSSILPSESDVTSESNITDGHSESSSTDLDTESNSLNTVNIEMNDTQKNFSLDSYGYAYLGGGFLTGNSKYSTIISSVSSSQSTDVIQEEQVTIVTESEPSTQTDSTQTVAVHHDSTAEEEILDSEISELAPEEHSTEVTDHHLFFIPPKSSPSVEEAENEESDESSETAESEKGPEKGGDWFEPTLAASHSSITTEATIENSSEKDETTLFNFEKEEGPEKGGELFEPTLPNILPSENKNKRNGSELLEQEGDVSTVGTITIEPTDEHEAGEAVEEANSEASGFHPVPENSEDLHYQDSEVEHDNRPEHHSNEEELHNINELDHSDSLLVNHDGEHQASPDKETHVPSEPETSESEQDQFENESINPTNIPEHHNIEFHYEIPEHEDESEHLHSVTEHHDTAADTDKEHETYTNEPEHPEVESEDLDSEAEHHDTEAHTEKNPETHTSAPEHHELESEEFDSETEHHDTAADTDKDPETHTSVPEHHEVESEDLDNEAEKHETETDTDKDHETHNSEPEHHQVESEDLDAEAEHYDTKADTHKDPETPASEPEHHEVESELTSEAVHHDTDTETDTNKDPDTHTSEPEHHEVESGDLKSEAEHHDTEVDTEKDSETHTSEPEHHEVKFEELDSETEHHDTETDTDKDLETQTSEPEHHEVESEPLDSEPEHHDDEEDQDHDSNIEHHKSDTHPFDMELENNNNEPEHLENAQAPEHHNNDLDHHDMEPLHPNSGHHIGGIEHHSEIAGEKNLLGTESRPYPILFQMSNPTTINVIATYKEPENEEVTDNQYESHIVTEANALGTTEVSEESTTPGNINEDGNTSDAIILDGEETKEKDSPNVIDTTTTSESSATEQESITTKDVEISSTTKPNADSNESPEVTENKNLLDTGKDLIGAIASNIGLGLRTNLHNTENNVFDSLEETVTSEPSHLEVSSHAFETHENTENKSNSNKSSQDEEGTLLDNDQTTLTSSHDKSSNKDDNISLLLNNESLEVTESSTDYDVATASTEKSFNEDSQNGSLNGNSLENKDGNHASTERTYFQDTSSKSPSDLGHEGETVNLDAELDKLLSDEDENVKSSDSDITLEFTSTNPSPSSEETRSPEGETTATMETVSDPSKEENETSKPSILDDNYRYINNHQVLQPYSLTDVISDVFKAPGYDSEVHNQFLKEQGNRYRRRSYHKITKRHEPSDLRRDDTSVFPVVRTGTVESDGYHVKDPGFVFSRGGVVDPAFKSIRVGTSDGYHATSSRGRSYQESSVPSSARITSPLIIVGGKESGKVIGKQQRLYANGAIKAVPIPYYTSPPFQPFKATVSEEELFPGASSPTPA